jgi:protein arginine N-methyltransferase 2
MSATNPTTAAAAAAAPQPAEAPPLPMENVRKMIDACATGDLTVIQQLIAQDRLYACQQDFETGISPLMAAAKAGNMQFCQELLDHGAPWNAIDRQGQCAGNYAMDAERWELVNMLVEWGTRAELILGELQRTQRKAGMNIVNNNPTLVTDQQPSTKPDYLRHQLRYNPDGTALLDEDDDAVMMEWERPIMKAHASIMMEAPGKRVMNVGFGMGIIDGILQEHNPNLHIIVEAHPDVYKKMLEDKWDQKPNVKICHGKWQDVLPELIKSGVEVDAVFYDTYGEHAFDMEEFHVLMSQMLSKPLGVYSFFNGLAPDNLFFHGIGKWCVCVWQWIDS